MSDQLRHVTVSVAVIHDKQHGFLLWNNKRWKGYAFPMRHIEPGDPPGIAVLDALGDSEFPLSLPNATAEYLECLGAFGYSEGMRVDTYYDYHVMEVDPGQTLDPSALDPDLRFFPYARIQAASNVTWSTRDIATSLVEYQEVVVAVIWRRSEADLEFLLVHKPRYGYFFPAIRRKTHGPLEEMAERAIRFDTAYRSEVDAEYWGDAIDSHESTRFTAGTRNYRMYVSLTHFSGIDLNAPGNPLEVSLDALETAKKAAGQQFPSNGYWSWFSVDQLKQSPNVSPQVASLRSTAIAAVEQWER